MWLDKENKDNPAGTGCFASWENLTSIQTVFKVVDDFDEVVVLGVTPVGRNFLDRRNKN